jgi:hypothetical protein
LKKITLCADENLIEAARERARTDNTPLNELFHRWLEDYVKAKQAEDAMTVIQELRGTVRTGGRKFSRGEMNER